MKTKRKSKTKTKIFLLLEEGEWVSEEGKWGGWVGGKNKAGREEGRDLYY